MITHKACKGTGKANGYGCGKVVPVMLNGVANRVYGLGKSCKCYNNWLLSDDGRETLNKSIITGKKKVKVSEKKDFRKRKQEFNTSSMMRNADTYFSRYIRLKHSEDGYCTCYTCGNIHQIKEVDNGHYQKREHKAVRYDENNCRPQCKTCNGDVKHNGKQIVFRANLVAEIGEEEVNKIDSSIKATGKYATSFYKEKSDTYRAKLNELQKELGVKYW